MLFYARPICLSAVEASDLLILNVRPGPGFILFLNACSIVPCISEIAGFL